MRHPLTEVEHTSGFSTVSRRSAPPLPALPSLPAPPEAAKRCPKLLEYLFLPVNGGPSRLFRSLVAPPPARLDGIIGKEFLSPNGETGDEGLFVEEEGGGRVGDLGASCAWTCGSGRDGRDGPDKGECCLNDGDGECTDDDAAAEDKVDDLNGCTELIPGLRMGDGEPPGEDPRDGSSFPPPTLVVLSFLNRATGSSFPEPHDLRDDEPSEIAEAAADSKPEMARVREGSAPTPRLGGLTLRPALPVTGNGVAELDGGGRTNLSATDGTTRGGDRDVRTG
jgi:hypothetical protein